nr:hypothetical protein [Promineifilum sp.]
HRDTEGHRGTQREEIGRLFASSSSGFLCVISVFLCVPLLFILAIVVHAHGTGTPQLLNAPTGPYLLSVWTDPDPLRADEAHVVVAVVEPETQEFIVSDVTVTVRLRSLADPTVERVETAETDTTNRLLFAAEFNDRVTPGRWQVGVSAAGARGAGDEVTFEIDVAPARGFNWLWLGVGGLGATVLLWLLASMRGPAQRRSRAR